MINVLFFHNTLVEYRIGFFDELSKICNLTVIFTDYNIGENIYQNKIDEKNIIFHYHVLTGKKVEKINKCNKFVEKYKPQWVIVPAMDDIYSIRICNKLMNFCHIHGIKVGFFWEKWRWKYNDMPIDRIIKEISQKILVSPVIKRCDALMAPGEKTAEYLRECRIKDKKIYKVHDASEICNNNTIDIYEKYGINKNKKIILFFGRIIFLKGLDNLIHAFAKLPHKYHQEYTLVICGDGPEKKHCEQIKKEYDLDSIIFTGNIIPKERVAFFENSDIFVLPDRVYKGRTDAWGLSLNEAMQFNNVLISTTGVGAAYELITEHNGFMVNEDSIDELYEVLIKSFFINMDQVKIENKRLCELYNYKNMANDIINALEGKGTCIY